jgi:FKBP-type peptidyl-prolyl cis-trans isomerase (trigger factor)
MYTILKKETQPKSQIKLSVSIPFSEIEASKQAAIQEIKDTIEIDGFRKGTAPDKMILDRVGESEILDRASRIALNKTFPKILEEEKIEVISAPQIEVTKLAEGNPFEFNATIAVMPVVVLPEYTKIKDVVPATDPAEHEVSDKELTDFIDSIRKQRAQAVKKATQEQAGQKDAAPVEVTEDDLPALDDAFVKSLGQFDGVDDFMTKVRAHLSEEKLIKAKQKRRGAVLDKLAAETTTEIPDILVEQELDRLSMQFENQLRSMGLDSTTYYDNIKKTREELRNDWRDDAEKRVKINLVLPEIANKEKIAPDMETVAKESEHVMAQVKDADPAHTRLYVYGALLNELVLEFLETGKKPEKKEGAHSHDHGEEGHVHDENCKH